MKKIILLMVMAALSGCMGSVKSGSETRLDTPLVIRDFNDVSDDYAARPTFVSVVERHQSGKMLSIKVDLFGADSHLYIPEEAVPSLLPMVDKYLEWEAMASERGDQLDKEIGSVSGWGAFKLKLHFFSGNVDWHYLVIRQCAFTCMGAESEDAFYFDRKGAEDLRRLLVQLGDGSLQTLNTDEVYQ